MLLPEACFEGVAFPGLGGGWRLVGVPEILDQLQEVPCRLGGAFGRGGIFRCAEVVLRPYRRGGLVRFFNTSRYLGVGRFRREWEVHRALWQAGFPTVEPLGWAWRKASGVGVEGVFLTAHMEAEPWPRDWEGSDGVLEQLPGLLGALSDWGLLAPDLNATNVLVRPGGGLCLLDWDRARWSSAGNLKARYRARLLRSLEKLQAPESVRARAAMAMGG